MDSLKQKIEHKNKLQEQFRNLLTVDGFINIFAYDELIKSEPQAFRGAAVEEYQQNEIKLRILSARTLIFLLILGVAFLFLGTWWKCIGAVMLAVALGLFIYRRGHLEGYVWGHQIGFENGINRTLCVDDSLSRIIHDEIIEIKTGSR
jgi:hypothetical protein